VDCCYVDYCVLFVTQNIEICSTEHVKSQHVNMIYLGYSLVARSLAVARIKCY